jgi:hypothetical protein
MAHLIDKDRIVAEIEKYISNYKGILNKVDKSSDDWVDSTLMLESKIDVLQHILSFIDTLDVKEVQEEAVSEKLEEAARKIATRHSHISGDIYYANDAWFFKKGAKWQKEHLWKPADGDDLPEIDREVIALLDNGKVVFAHRPDPKGWNGKNIITEKVEHYTPKTYDKGGWNQPNVKWWLDCLMPKEIEWLNNYHKTVYDNISPLLDTNTLKWLKEATSAL